MDEFDIDKRYEGIPGVSIGGYVAGLAAKELGPSVAVTLSKAVPPGSTVTLERRDAQVLLSVNGELAATAAPYQLETPAPESVAPEAAERASERYPGFDHHFFPNCFTCGPDRASGDGLRIFPGPVEGRPVVATLWRPPSSVWQTDRTVASEFLWAALDCPAIWGHIVHGGAQADDRAVSGRLELHQHAPVRGDAPSIVVGWPIDRQGRKVIAGAAIFSESGTLLVEARQTMILTRNGVPLHLTAWAARA
ncbi:MAG TPA: hypothetical protein VJT14_00040 [Candidatus Dormibacteraeota bacterium]|nr:hypothetical protein [Candidatus Dormibacteraeota bacterium]